MNSKMKDFVKGIMAGLVTKARMLQGKEPIGYNYGLLGYTLPALPEWADGKYACMRWDIFSRLCHLLVFEDYTIGYVEVVTSIKSWVVSNVGHAKEYEFDPDGDSEVWKLVSETDGSVQYSVAVGNLGWANFEVRKEDGTIKQITTDPVPVYE